MNNKIKKKVDEGRRGRRGKRRNERGGGTTDTTVKG
jgi:hypothetical protein